MAIALFLSCSIYYNRHYVEVFQDQPYHYKSYSFHYHCDTFVNIGSCNYFCITDAAVITIWSIQYGLTVSALITD
uniref:Uncharacterized protein n=1 Tax=Octopus bimaculoides TaxID=37653 RepID=A0A0L8GY85_OCTBM